MEWKNNKEVGFPFFTEIRLSGDPCGYQTGETCHAVNMKHAVEKNKLQITSDEKRCFEFQTMNFQSSYFSHGKL